MTENEAIKQIRKQICNEKGVQKYCRDNCMHGIEHCAYSMAIQALEEIQQYRAIGTIEEFKALKEKATPKKPIDRTVCKDGIITFGDVGTCPNCGHIVAEDMFVCEDCLQVIDWEDGE